MWENEGRLEYGPGLKAVIWADQGISDLYRKLIPKYYYAKPQLHPAHITVVRLGRETAKNMEVWNKYNGELVAFSYDSAVNFDGTYFYLNVHSERIGDIREELGLPRFRVDKRCYHLSIANVKNG